MTSKVEVKSAILACNGYFLPQGKTRSTCTGPSAAYEGQYYIHLEATDYRRVRWRKNYMDYLIPAQEGRQWLLTLCLYG